MSKRNKCDANGYRRRQVRARIRARRDPCAICGRPIDYDLPAGDDWAFEVDEVVSRWRGGSPIDLDNCQAVHRVCNRIKYQREMAEEKERKNRPPMPAKSSRSW